MFRQIKANRFNGMINRLNRVIRYKIIYDVRMLSKNVHRTNLRVISS